MRRGNRRQASGRRRMESKVNVEMFKKFCYNFWEDVTKVNQKVLIRVKGLLLQRKGDEGFG